MPRKEDVLRFRISAELKAEAEKLAEERGESLSLLVRQALRELLEKEKRDAAPPPPPATVPIVVYLKEGERPAESPPPTAQTKGASRKKK